MNEMSKTIYTGDRVPDAGGAGVVTYCENGGTPRPLPPRWDVRNHSPDGFQWGYGGSGPAQLALALCIHALDGDVARAEKVYQQFKAHVVAALPDAWAMSRGHILAVIERVEGSQA